MFICFVSDITDLGGILSVLKDNHFPVIHWDDLVFLVITLDIIQPAGHH